MSTYAAILVLRIRYLLLPQIVGSSVTINCLRPADYFPLGFFQVSWMSALQLQLFIRIHIVIRVRTYCAFVTIRSVPLTLQLQAGIQEGRSS